MNTAGAGETLKLLEGPQGAYPSPTDRAAPLCSPQCTAQQRAFCSQERPPRPSHPVPGEACAAPLADTCCRSLRAPLKRTWVPRGPPCTYLSRHLPGRQGRQVCPALCRVPRGPHSTCLRSHSMMCVWERMEWPESRPVMVTEARVPDSGGDLGKGPSSSEPPFPSVN